MTGSRLRVVYVAGIALNALALALSALAGEWLITATFAVILVYLGIRYRMVDSP